MRTDTEGSLPLLSLNPSIINVLTLGHKGLYNDFSYFWLMQNIVHEDSTPLDPDQIYKQIKLVTQHLPDIESLYTLSCFIMMLDFHQPQRCLSIAEEGMKALPNSWLIPALVGYIYAFILKDPVKASYYYKKTESIPKSPAYLGQLSRRLLKGVIEKKDGEEALRAIIDGTDDPGYRNFLMNFLNKRK